jgi:hypothetical protein
VILNLHVADAEATARHLGAMGATWLAPLEYREQAGAWFGTVLDPDGNYVQIIELTPAYRAARVPGRPPAACTASWPGSAGRRGGLGPAAGPRPRTRAAFLRGETGPGACRGTPGRPALPVPERKLLHLRVRRAAVW